MSAPPCRVAVLVSGRPGGAMDVRARALFGRLPPERFAARLVYHEGRPVQRVRHFVAGLRAFRPHLIYLLDPIYAGAAAIGLYRAGRRVPLLVDTGDLVYALAREMGQIGPLGLAVVAAGERLALGQASALVVRSDFHRQTLAGQRARVHVIPDGVDLRQFFPQAAPDQRMALGFGPDELVLGGLGTTNWSTRQQLSYGWEVVEALARLRDLPVRGLWIGGGDAQARLAARANDLSVAARFVCTGWVDYHALNPWLNVLDIALLTQANTPAARVRTTGKLPHYLACDRYILASDVAPAVDVLRPKGMLLPYEGARRDDAYPARLAEKVRALAADRDALQLNGWGVALARAHFDYDRLAEKLAVVLEETLAVRGAGASV